MEFMPKFLAKGKLVAIAAISLGIAMSADRVLACTVYWNPKIDGLEVDRCIHSYQYPDGCSKGATEHAATKFCQQKGHRYARSWEWVDGSTDYQRDVVKLLEEPNSSYFRVQRGSFVFTGILCRD